MLLSDLLQTGGTFVRGLSPAGLRDALVAAGLTVEPADDGRCRVDGNPEQVGRAAAAAGEVLLELRTADSGLEDLFFQLTGSVDRRAA